MNSPKPSSSGMKSYKGKKTIKKTSSKRQTSPGFEEDSVSQQYMALEAQRRSMEQRCLDLGKKIEETHEDVNRLTGRFLEARAAYLSLGTEKETQPSRRRM